MYDTLDLSKSLLEVCIIYRELYYMYGMDKGKTRYPSLAWKEDKLLIVMY